MPPQMQLDGHAGWVHAVQGSAVNHDASVGRQQPCEDMPAAC